MNFKFNILYLLLPLSVGVCWKIATDLAGQGTHSFFATAESEAQTLNFDQNVVVQDLRTSIGSQVKRGDTLAIFLRTELERSQLTQLANIRQIQTENTSKNSVLQQERDLIVAKKNAQLQQIETEIQVLRAEDSLQNALKNAIYPQNQTPTTARQTRIGMLQQSRNDIEKQAEAQLQQLQTQQNSNLAIEKSHVAQVQQSISFVALDRQRLALIAPMDGYVEQVFVAKGALVPAYKELVKINPKLPNRVVGFIHESADIPFQLGDTVQLMSYARPTLTAAARIVGCSPKLVELPLRLRKFSEIKAWGREIYLSLPDSNQFYIGEKITVTLKNVVK